MDKRYGIGAAVIVAVSALASATVVLSFFDRVADKLRCPARTDCQKLKKELANVDAGGPQTFMVIGSDSRYEERKLGYKERSDTLVLVRMDPDRGTISMLSFPRDLKVSIPGYGVDKLNAAYALGGVRLSLKTIKQLTGLKINHVLNVNFRGFKEVVDEIGCVYFDVDHHYYHSNIGLAPSQQYAEINAYPGYQKLCGPRALDFVRYRHDANGDLTRQLRQQAFIREARHQVGSSELLDDRDKLIKIFTKNVRTDIRGRDQLIKMLKLGVVLVGSPIHSVHMESRIESSYVYSNQSNIDKAVREFLGLKNSGISSSTATFRSSSADKKKGKKSGGNSKKNSSSSYSSLGLEAAVDAGVEQAAFAAPKASFPVLFPRLRLMGSQYEDKARVYWIRGINRHLYRGVKLVLKTGDGFFYGIMETNWTDPPILKNPSETMKVRGRTMMLFYDKSRLRMVAFKIGRAVYWISNTYENKLSDKQMIRIASSMTRKP